MFDRLKRIIAIWHDQAEIMALTQRDLDELEVTRAQLLHLAAMPPEIPARMNAMAAIFGVAPEDLQYPRQDYVQMLDTCAACKALRECDHLLSDPSAHPAHCGFCPNAQAFAA
jgi:hypothetical protein